MQINHMQKQYRVQGRDACNSGRDTLSRCMSYIRRPNRPYQRLQPPSILWTANQTSSSPAPCVPCASTSAAASTPTPPAAQPWPPFLDPREGVRDTNGSLLLRNLTLSELQQWCESIGETSRRAHHLYRWLYGNGRWIRSLDEADADAHSFSKSFKDKVSS